MNFTDEITVLINSLRDLSGVGICYYDLRNFFHYEKHGVKANRGHYCDFCVKARSLPNGKISCEKSDKNEAVELAKQYKEPFFFECHMGMRELVIPLMRDDLLLGLLFVGQCRGEDDREAEIKANAKKMAGEPEELWALYRQLPVLSQKNILNVGNILGQYFSTKILNSELMWGEGAAHVVGGDLAYSMRLYVQNNYKLHLSLGEIAEEFNVNPSYASRCFSRKYGMTVTAYIMHVRLEKAKMFLVSTEIPIGNVALNIGFDDVNYFCRIFKRQEGCSPGQYRRQNKSASN